MQAMPLEREARALLKSPGADHDACPPRHSELGLGLGLGLGCVVEQGQPRAPAEGEGKGAAYA